jgi:drug/metabolite transporter (DMT)-like permease
VNNQTIALYQPLFLSVFAALVAVVLWAIAPLLVNIAGAVPPFRLATIALLSGAVATLPMSLRKQKIARRSAPQIELSLKWKLVIYGLVPALIFGAVASYLAGMGKAPAAEAALITYTWPILFIVLSQWMFHRRVPLPVITGAGIAFCGAAVLISPDSLGAGVSDHYAGYALALLAACCWALYSWICQAAPVAIAPQMPLLFLVAGAGAVTADTLTGSTPGMPSGGALLAGIALGLGPYGLAMVAWDLALRTGPTALIGSLAYAVPVLAAFLLVVAGIAAPDWRLPVAALLVVAGSVVASMKSGHRRQAQSELH